MPINMTRLMAMDQIQEDAQNIAGIEQAFAPQQDEPAKASPARLDFGQAESVAQPLAQSAAIQSYQPITKPVEQTLANLDPLPPQDAPLQGDQSMQGYLQDQAARNISRETNGVYTEQLSNNVGNTIDRSYNLSSQFRQLGQQTPEQRASIGARLGAGLGAAIGGGAVGALAGSSVGAMAARALGVIQSGEHDLNTRRQGVMDTLNTMGAIPQDGSSPYGGNFRFTNDPSFRLENLAGEGNRTIYEVDQSNPFTNRTTEVARPLARYIAEGFAGQRDDGKGNAMKAIDGTTGMLVNMFTDNASDIQTVYSRARQFAEKLGITNDKIRTFFSVNRGKINPQEARDIKKGLDTLYA